MENITTTPERTARKSIEDIENAAREAQKRLDRTKRIDTYYGTDLPGGRTKRHTNIYLFRPDDLDNEDIIFAVDESPTYARSQQKLEEIRGYSSAAQKREQNEVEPPTTMQGTISFA